MESFTPVQVEHKTCQKLSKWIKRSKTTEKVKWKMFRTTATCRNLQKSAPNIYIFIFGDMEFKALRWQKARFFGVKSISSWARFPVSRVVFVGVSQNAGATSGSKWFNMNEFKRKNIRIQYLQNQECLLLSQTPVGKHQWVVLPNWCA